MNLFELALGIAFGLYFKEILSGFTVGIVGIVAPNFYSRLLANRIESKLDRLILLKEKELKR